MTELPLIGEAIAVAAEPRLAGAKIGVVTFPGTLDDRDAARAVRLAGGTPVALWHADTDTRRRRRRRDSRRILLRRLPPRRRHRALRAADVQDHRRRQLGRQAARAGHLQRLPDPHRVAPAARLHDQERPPEVHVPRPGPAGGEQQHRLDRRLRGGPGNHGAAEEPGRPVHRGREDPRRPRGRGPRGVPLRGLQPERLPPRHRRHLQRRRQRGGPHAAPRARGGGRASARSPWTASAARTPTASVSSPPS